MKKLICMLFFVPIFMAGCVETNKTGVKEFVEVCNDHKVLTNETNEALILSIEDEMRMKRQSGQLTAATEKSFSDLIKRLTTINRQSDLISKYVNTSVVDQALVSEMISSKWKNPK